MGSCPVKQAAMAKTNQDAGYVEVQIGNSYLVCKHNQSYNTEDDMEKIKKKFIETMTNRQTADFLRSLASGIESGKLELEEETYDWAEIEKIKISFKNQESQLLVKTKLKGETSMDLEMDFEEEDTDPGSADDIPPDYKKLKKRMKRSFKDIHYSMVNDQFPDEHVMNVFAGDCALMTGFKGYGDENYSGFLENVREMTSAYNQKDMLQLRHAVSRLTRLMKDCHHLHK